MRAGIRLVLTGLEPERGFRLVGELDLSTTRQLASALDPEIARGGDIVLDMADLTFMDSTGLQVLIRSSLEVAGRGRLILRSPGSLVRSILELAVRTDKLPSLVIEDAAPT